MIRMPARLRAHAQTAALSFKSDDIGHADARRQSLPGHRRCVGEFQNFRPSAVSHVAWLTLLYLSGAASIVSFTAYIWLLHHESSTKVGTFAYVNPLFAVALGRFFAGEPLGSRTIIGALFILISVVAITTPAPPNLPSLSKTRPDAFCRAESSFSNGPLTQ
jgi:EamA-like transporter family